MKRPLRKADIEYEMNDEDVAHPTFRKRHPQPPAITLTDAPEVRQRAARALLVFGVF
jgi:hypothetical protein